MVFFSQVWSSFPFFNLWSVRTFFFFSPGEAKLGSFPCFHERGLFSECRYPPLFPFPEASGAWNGADAFFFSTHSFHFFLSLVGLLFLPPVPEGGVAVFVCPPLPRNVPTENRDPFFQGGPPSPFSFSSSLCSPFLESTPLFLSFFFLPWSRISSPGPGQCRLPSDPSFFLTRDRGLRPWAAAFFPAPLFFFFCPPNTTPFLRSRGGSPEFQSELSLQVEAPLLTPTKPVVPANPCVWTVPGPPLRSSSFFKAPPFSLLRQRNMVCLTEKVVRFPPLGVFSFPFPTVMVELK